MTYSASESREPTVVSSMGCQESAMIEPAETAHEPDAPDSAPVGEVAAVPAPVIVIERRQRGFLSRLTPPALILLAALAISSYQRVTPIRPIASRFDLVGVPGPKAEPPGRPSPLPRVVFRSQTAGSEKPANEAALAPSPSPPLTLAAVDPSVPVAGAETESSLPKASGTPSPFDLEPVAGLTPRAVDEPEVPPAAAVPARTPPPVFAETIPEPPDAEMSAPVEEVSKDEILQDIKREADRKDAHREEMERLKPRAEGLLAAEAIAAAAARIGEERAPFLIELKKLLKELGNNAGTEIDQLCDQFERNPRPEIRSAYLKTIYRISSRMSREMKVEKMRSFGIPEPMILDSIANELHRTMNSRGGPRDENEVRVRAAKELLKYPVTPTRKATASRAAAGVPIPTRPAPR